MPDVQMVEAMNDSYRDDVIDKLFGTGQFSVISTFDGSVGTPTVAQLQEFDAVLVSTDNPGLNNRVLFGDNLADYVDSGGGVVLSMFTYNSGGLGIEGRWLTDNYWAIDAPGSQTTGAASMGTVYMPDHPIMEEVTVFAGDVSYRPATTAVVSGATRIANWDDGKPLVAVRTIGETRRADLGFFPASSDALSNWFSSTDGARLMGNALTWVAEMPDPYESGDTFPIDIDSGPAESCSVSSTINVSGGPTSLRKVSLDVNFNFPNWVLDLLIYLESPEGTLVEISTGNGGSSGHYTNTTFNDAAANSITAGSAPFLGIYQPEGNLATLTGEDANGTWTLRIQDDTCFDAGGTLEEWRLIVR